MVSSPTFSVGATLLVLVMALLGMGNGAVFQLVPQRFPREIGVITGVVGTAGGLGGFFLPTILGSVKQLTGRFSGAFLLFGAIAFCGVLGLLYVSKSWQSSFLAEGGLATADAPEPLREIPVKVVHVREFATKIPAMAEYPVPHEA